MNKVILQGNVTRDPEVKYTTGGTAVANTSLATNKKYKKGDEYVEETEFHELTIWGAPAEVWGEHVKKGQQMLVVGEIKTDKWQDSEGNNRYTTKVVVREFEFCGKKVAGSSQKSEPEGEPVAVGADSTDSAVGSEDDVPF